MQALARANEVKRERADLKAELRNGEVSLAEALTDPRGSTLPVGVLLRAQRQWGSLRVQRLLADLRISPLRAVGELTERQRRVISVAAE